jgi:hypothetical protein
MRQLLAKFNIAKAERGEKDPKRLIETALLRLRMTFEKWVSPSWPPMTNTWATRASACPFLSLRKTLAAQTARVAI